MSVKKQRKRDSYIIKLPVHVRGFEVDTAKCIESDIFFFAKRKLNLIGVQIGKL